MGILVIVPVVSTYMALTQAKTFAHPNETPAALGWGRCYEGQPNIKSATKLVFNSIQSTLFKHGKWLSKLVFRHAV